MNAVVACGIGRSDSVARSWTRLAVPVSLCLLGTCAWAQDENASETTLAQMTLPLADERPRPQVELSTISLPRFDNVDGASHSSRIDMTWLPPRRSALGLSVGMTSPSGTMVPPPFTANSTSVDLGLHWRYTLDANYRLDVTAWRRMVPADTLSLVQTREPMYGARVEMRIGPAPIKSGLVAERGFIGFQLESGARIVVRKRHGGPMIYYRTKF